MHPVTLRPVSPHSSRALGGASETETRSDLILDGDYRSWSGYDDVRSRPKCVSWCVSALHCARVLWCLALSTLRSLSSG